MSENKEPTKEQTESRLLTERLAEKLREIDFKNWDADIVASKLQGILDKAFAAGEKAAYEHKFKGGFAWAFRKGEESKTKVYEEVVLQLVIKHKTELEAQKEKNQQEINQLYKDVDDCKLEIKLLQQALSEAVEAQKEKDRHELDKWQEFQEGCSKCIEHSVAENKIALAEAKKQGARELAEVLGQPEKRTEFDCIIRVPYETARKAYDKAIQSKLKELDLPHE